MQWLIFSDTHLTNHFDQGKFDLLKQLISSADRVVINGDFWDYFVCSFDDFINSPWQDLFSLLKAKKAVYIYGNHDSPEFCDPRTTLFSDEALLEYRFSVGHKSFYVSHGHTILKNVSVTHPGLVTFPITRWFIRWYGWFKEGLLVRLLGGRYLRRTFHNGNDLLKSWQKDKLTPGVYFVCGHTHRPELSARFINTGFVDWGLAQYLVIDETGVNLKYARY